MNSELRNKGRNWAWTCDPPTTSAQQFGSFSHLDGWARIFQEQGRWDTSEVITWFAQDLLKAEKSSNSQGNYYHHYKKMLIKKLDFKDIHLSTLAEKSRN